MAEANQRSAIPPPISSRKSRLLRVQPDESLGAPAMVKHIKEVSDIQIEKGGPTLLKIVNVGAKPTPSASRGTRMTP